MTIDMMISLTEGIATKADKMRVLERHGYARADIARFLGVRYQQVRNTLEGDKRTGYNPEIIPQRDDNQNATGFRADQLRELSIDEEGFVLLPPDLVEAVDDGEDPQLYALKVPGGLFVCSSSGLIARAASSFKLP
jgi:hypothetical protein